LDGARPGRARQLRGKQEHGRTKAFAAARLEILSDSGDGVHRRYGFVRDLFFDLIQLLLDQVEDLTRR
jgi:hypothetical protein